MERDTLTNNWFGMGKKLSEKGLDFNLYVTQVGQQNLRGGLSTHRRAGEYAGRYDLEGQADLDKLVGWPGGKVYALARSGWSDGIDRFSVGSLTNTDAVAIGNQPIDLWQLFYEQGLFDGKVRVRVGKIDLTNCLDFSGCKCCKACFDGNNFANDERCQFLNKSLVNNPTIPFPDPGLGAMVHVEPTDWWYVSAAVADAQPDFREKVFNVDFDGSDHSFSMYETGFLPKVPSSQGPLHGAYRLGMWYDPQSKDRLNGNGAERDGVGFYTSCNQMLLKENGRMDDMRGLGVFARYGFANADVDAIKSFWSTGLQYRGLIPTRDNDVTAVGVGQGRLSRQNGFTESNETILEWYYNIELMPWLRISPDVQYVHNPGGDASVKDAVVIGARVGIAF